MNPIEEALEMAREKEAGRLFALDTLIYNSDDLSFEAFIEYVADIGKGDADQSTIDLLDSIVQIVKYRDYQDNLGIKQIMREAIARKAKKIYEEEK